MSIESTSSTPKTRRRKAKPEAAAPEMPVVASPEPVAEEPAIKMLTRDELYQLRLLEAEVRASRAESETCRLRKKWMLALLDPKGTVEAEEKRQERWAKEARDNAQKYETLKARISMRLNVDLNKAGFDPETGLVVTP